MKNEGALKCVFQAWRNLSVRCVITSLPTRGSTCDNRANLAAGFIERMDRKYEGTRLGRQELYAEMLEDVPGALWTRQLLEQTRVAAAPCDRYRVVAEGIFMAATIFGPTVTLSTGTVIPTRWIGEQHVGP